MVDVVGYNSNIYKKSCGNCEYYDKDTYRCKNPEKNKYYKNKNSFLKSYVPSDIACKYFSFKPNSIYTNPNVETRLVESYIYDNHKYIPFKIAICNHIDIETGKSLLEKLNSDIMVCTNCCSKFRRVI